MSSVDFFLLGVASAFAFLLVSSLICLVINYNISKYYIIKFILDNKDKYEKYYFKINSYNSAKAIYKIISNVEKDFICKRLDITSYWHK